MSVTNSKIEKAKNELWATNYFDIYITWKSNLNNLQAILLIQFDIFNHKEKERNKIILVTSCVFSSNLQAILLIQFDIILFKKSGIKYYLEVNIGLSNNLHTTSNINPVCIFKHEQKKYNRITLVSKYCNK